VKLPRLTKPRALAEGIEFFLQGRGGRLRFLYPLRGFIQVSREPRGEVSGEASVEAQPPVPVVSRPQELLLVQLQGESYRPIEKPFPPGLGQALFSRRPTPFRYTSVPELARKYLREVSEVSA
jgi:hypothetical protein